MFDGKEVIRASFSPRQNYNTLRVLYVAPKNYLDVSFLQPHIKRDLQSYRGQVEIEQIEAHDLPTHWLEYRNVDILIINLSIPIPMVNVRCKANEWEQSFAQFTSDSGCQ